MESAVTAPVSGHIKRVVVQEGAFMLSICLRSAIQCLYRRLDQPGRLGRGARPLKCNVTLPPGTRGLLSFFPWDSCISTYRRTSETCCRTSNILYSLCSVMMTAYEQCSFLSCVGLRTEEPRESAYLYACEVFGGSCLCVVHHRGYHSVARRILRLLGSAMRFFGATTGVPYTQTGPSLATR